MEEVKISEILFAIDVTLIAETDEQNLNQTIENSEEL